MHFLRSRLSRSLRRYRLAGLAIAVFGAHPLAGQVTSGARLGTIELRSSQGALAVSPGGIALVTVWVVNETPGVLGGLSIDFTAGGQVKLAVPSSIGTNYLDRLTSQVPLIARGDSVSVTARILTPRRTVDGSLPLWAVLKRDNIPLTPQTDLQLTIAGVRGAQTSVARAPAASPVTPVAPAPVASAPVARSVTTFISDVDTGIPEAVTVRNDDIAVIIGVRNYKRAPEVSYAINDARSMRTYAERTLGIKPGNIIYTEDATLSDLKVLFGDTGQPQGRLADYVKPGRSEVWVFYSGHGAPDPSERRAYLMPADADANRLALTGLSIDMLYENLSKIGAKHVTVILDACFSGASGRGQMLISSASPIGIQVTDPASQFANGSGATIIAAAQGQQLANWYDEEQHGMLTYFLLKGLQGSADIDGNGAITVGEMRTWLTDRADGVPYEARRRHGRDQNPQVRGPDSRVLVQKRR